MSRRRTRRGSEDASISFLDVICCGFGAIILLLVIVKPNQPLLLEESLIENDGQVRALQERLFQIRGQVRYLETDLNAKHEQLGEDQRRVAILRSEFSTLNSRKASIELHGADDSEEILDLEIAVQSLSKEMKKLLADKKSQNNYIAGLPVDSEYIIFVIDSSGSMVQNAWARVVAEVANTLRIYPKIKGIQVINTNGQYLMPGSADQWIKDSPGQRRAIINKLPRWVAFSPSSPVGGINAAIRRFYDPKKKISLYVLGDDFEGRSVTRVLKIIEATNKKNSRGESLVRIHAIGFPVHYSPNGSSARGSAVRYASLMRKLAEQNNGTFVGLDSAR